MVLYAPTSRAKCVGTHRGKSYIAEGELKIVKPNRYSKHWLCVTASDLNEMRGRLDGLAALEPEDRDKVNNALKAVSMTETTEKLKAIACSEKENFTAEWNVDLKGVYSDRCRIMADIVKELDIWGKKSVNTELYFNAIILPENCRLDIPASRYGILKRRIKSGGSVRSVFQGICDEYNSPATEEEIAEFKDNDMWGWKIPTKPLLKDLMGDRRFFEYFEKSQGSYELMLGS
jgi:hypothetical protein